jgi:X-X-X-Leu-X-X-Gly heptad repeat protein
MPPFAPSDGRTGFVVDVIPLEPLNGACKRETQAGAPIANGVNGAAGGAAPIANGVNDAAGSEPPKLAGVPCCRLSAAIPR